jgi:hypothetical protein
VSAVVADTARQVSQQLRAHVDLQLEQQLPRITAHLADTITAQVRVTACVYVRVTACDAIPRNFVAATVAQNRPRVICFRVNNA